MRRTRALQIMAATTLAAATVSGCAAALDAPTPVQSAPPGNASKQAARKAPIGLRAARTAFAPGALHSGGAYTSVKVTITNSSTKNLHVNPLFFAITDSEHTKHEIVLGQDKRQIATLTLAPGENATGVITAEGKFTPKTVSFARAGVDEIARAAVG